jgi:hypothetical protein
LEVSEAKRLAAHLTHFPADSRPILLGGRHRRDTPGVLPRLQVTVISL